MGVAGSRRHQGKGRLKPAREGSPMSWSLDLTSGGHCGAPEAFNQGGSALRAASGRMAGGCVEDAWREERGEEVNHSSVISAVSDKLSRNSPRLR